MSPAMAKIILGDPSQPVCMVLKYLLFLVFSMFPFFNKPVVKLF